MLAPRTASQGERRKPADAGRRGLQSAVPSGCPVADSVGTLRTGGIGSPAAEVHRGDCWAAGKRLQEISRERAIAELADAARACEVCPPDRVLGT
ncbi:DUF6233 domain-containing protein [Streptomyces sp. NPDC057543]|uniref:DUF6233 domain-containing protein n=1 Tax=Streptomyces sp. NPDC057543 TaxID=3346163 RepID=UPI003673E4B2